jgi:hypothetical protein
MTESYWHLLDEDEWADLIRSEQLSSIDRYPTDSEEAAAHDEPNGATLKRPGPESDAVAAIKAAPVAAEVASLMACLGIPLHALNLTGDRGRVAVARLKDILRERSAPEASSRDWRPSGLITSGRLRASRTS